MCDSRYTVRYGGLAAGFASDATSGVDYRFQGGYGVRRRREDTADPATRHDEVVVSSGGLAQVGYQWRYFGFRVGLGAALWDDGGLDGTVLVPVTLRVGAWDGLHLRLGVLDEVPIERGLVWLEAGYGLRDRSRIAIGLRAHAWTDAPIATVGGELRVTPDVFVGARLGLGLEDDLNGFAHVNLGWSFEL